MSHFYGVLQGSRGETTRCATKLSGLHVVAAGWQGAISVHVWHNDAGKDMYRVYLDPWKGSGGQTIMVAEGELNANGGEA